MRHPTTRTAAGRRRRRAAARTRRRRDRRRRPRTGLEAAGDGIPAARRFGNADQVSRRLPEAEERDNVAHCVPSLPYRFARALAKFASVFARTSGSDWRALLAAAMF